MNLNVYVEEKTKEQIESQPTDDLNRISSFFWLNQLVNLQQGKTKTFSTSKRLPKGETVKKSLVDIWQQRDCNNRNLKKIWTMDTTPSLARSTEELSKSRVMSSLQNVMDNAKKSKIFRCMILPCIKYFSALSTSTWTKPRKKKRGFYRVRNRTTSKKLRRGSQRKV